MAAVILAYTTGCVGVTPTHSMPPSMVHHTASLVVRHSDADVKECDFHRWCMRESLLNSPLTLSTGAMVAPGDGKH